MVEPVSAAIAVGGSLLSGIFGANAARKSAKAEERRFREAQAINERRYQEGLGMFAPYREAGAQGLDAYQTSLGLNGGDALEGAWRNSPDYRLAMDESQRAVAARAANAGSYFSGNALKGATDSAMRTSAGLFGNYRAGLRDLAGIGQDAVRGSVGLGESYSGASAQNLGNIGRAQSQGIMGRYNALASGVQGGLGAYNYYNNQQPGGFAAMFGGR